MMRFLPPSRVAAMFSRVRPAHAAAVFDGATRPSPSAGALHHPRPAAGARFPERSGNS
ncbi:hypothetical protein GQ55_5G086200 [Panicum hallii var. hallii]|uniref:Uncharacterized protein n=2 Tax=Panicum hallii TaxID=206008 RepID=A0A2T7DE61_9POAL|nr:hypothetical protein PAHAL_5G084500 [Panicum hallii]PUZ53886.1 hypothetical protein GQ55_5G086200 [Panicum hallii var. hallii]